MDAEKAQGNGRAIPSAVLLPAQYGGEKVTDGSSQDHVGEADEQAIPGGLENEGIPGYLVQRNQVGESIQKNGERDVSSKGEAKFFTSPNDKACLQKA